MTAPSGTETPYNPPIQLPAQDESKEADLRLLTELLDKLSNEQIPHVLSFLVGKLVK